MLGTPLINAESIFEMSAPELPKDENSEQYWNSLRKYWVLADDEIELNCASFGPSPLPVIKAVTDHLMSSEQMRDPSYYPRFGYEENETLKDLRRSLAVFMNCDVDELALVRNATEGNNVICNGLDFEKGDEILLTDQEHVSGFGPWEQKALRYGLKLKYVALPRPPKDDDEIVEGFRKLITNKTKLIFFSHITTATGLILPAAKICKMAREMGVLTHIDGAHSIGQIPIDLKAIGCDFYATSPHKWLLAPKGTGCLFIRRELADKLWVSITTEDWKNKSLGAYRFSVFGTSNLSVMVGLKAALDFFHKIGPEKIYARVHELAKRIRDEFAKYEELRLPSASREEFFGGIMSAEPSKPGYDGLKRITDECYKEKIRVIGDVTHLRISPHIYNSQAELDRFFEVLRKQL